MERQAHYAFVGLITLVLAGAAFLFAFWLIQGSFNETYAEYDVLFNTPVNGLTEGGEVHFNGIKVGEVKELKLGQVNTSQVIATVRVEASTPIRVDSTAVLEPLGVTGLNYIQISPGSKEAALLKKASGMGAPNPVIRATESRLDKLLSGSGGVIESAYESLSRINKLLSDQNLNSFAQSLKNIEDITGDIGEVTEDLKSRKQMLDDAHEAIVQAGIAAQNLSKLADSVDVLVKDRVPETMARIDSAATELANAATEVQTLAKTIERPVNEITESTLPAMAESLQNLNSATRAVEQLVDEIRSSPQGLIGKAKAKDRKVN
ncbi:MlaD family protein [Asticcacaulis sp. YBE204]|uniref:MlaD family protein n=1 Tax=Asticcacaulis sp. YBE204 TaxID=1282363 RepID=UPI0003C3C6DF|nr:MlaD family protein [Asticcacaulis sp. YBE204]ESQ79043.1 mammalian cell entry protein [Asticcacaulis sp. YBE204]